MRNLITTIALTLLLAGCFGGGGGGGGSSAPAFPRVTVSGIGLTTTVTHAGTYDVVVSGLTDTVTIGLNQSIRQLSIAGVDDDVLIGSSSTVSGTVTLTGVNATLHLPPGSLISVTVTGVGAQVLYDAVGG